MSECLKHECGIALIRLRKPLSYYKKKYGSWSYGIEKLYLLMEKQHNRGQDGAGVASVKLHPSPGDVYMNRTRSNSHTPLRDVFDEIMAGFETQLHNPADDEKWVRQHIPYAGEVLLGHLRYQTQGGRTIDFVHPVMRSNNWRSRSLVVAGNFNLTNAAEVFNQLVDIGQYPHNTSDTVSLLERMGHLLDRQNEERYTHYRKTDMSRLQIARTIENELNIPHLLQETTKKLDGGYVICGIIGQGDAFVVRDPHGIRPAFYYTDDEIIVVASERPVIQTALRAQAHDVHELLPGQALIIKKDSDYSLPQIMEPREPRACSFERIYFSRGTDKDIYHERKKLGEQLTEKVLQAIQYDINNTIFSYIPNTAEIAFYGLMKGVEDYMLHNKQQRIINAGKLLSPDELWHIITERPRIEKIAVKDAKMRTFITEDSSRNDMVEHVYDVTYGVVRPGQDTVVIVDDSIVRGTTLKQSILKIVDRLEPKKIVVVSSAPQIRYPDCYGIEMSRMKEFCAFLAAIELLKERSRAGLIEEVYQRCKQQINATNDQLVNHVKEIYRPFTPEEISRKIVTLLRPQGMRAEVELVYQSLEGLHVACPRNHGDWYFSGNYPTPGGLRMVNNAFIHYFEDENKQLKLPV
ncbi:MAG: amidophosphoribosyltransferase [Prevotellaceae bacterium]|jgi:amidophosphoribosyltransferase|nr:amidophosphoribosyltransferase [Prevotellaceae bacterium]